MPHPCKVELYSLLPVKTVCIVLNDRMLCSVQWMHSVTCNAVCNAHCALQYSVHCIGVCSFKQVWQCKRNLFQVNGNLLAKNSIPSKARITRFLCSKYNFSIIFDTGFLSLLLTTNCLPKIGFASYWHAIYSRCSGRSPTNVLSNTAVTNLCIYISLHISRLKSLLCLHFVLNKD